jgi:hypothetical protein
MTIMSVLEKNWVRGGLVRALGMAISMVVHHHKGLRYKRHDEVASETVCQSIATFRPRKVKENSGLKPWSRKTDPDSALPPHTLSRLSVKR